MFEDNVPLRRVFRNGNNGWMTDNRILIAKRLRDQAYRNYRQDRTDIHFANYRRARNKLKSIIRKVRKNYCMRYFSSCDRRQMWRKIKSIGIQDSNESLRFPISLNEFNEFSRMTNVDDGIYNIGFSEGFSFRNVDENDVLNAVFRIKSEAVGADGIPSRFLRFIAPAILRLLTFIINKILTTSDIPRVWKVGRIVPVPKTKTPRICADYRPITILPVCAKVLEFIIRDQMLSHLKSNNMIHPYQSGFRSAHSTTGVLLDITETIRENYDDERVSVLIFLDFCKAFDSISHRRLISKLSHFFGFSSSACKLIYSFLTTRCQFVRVGQENSRVISIYRGIPQGSILGPLLFLLYTNDLFNELSFSKIYTYADDIQLLDSFDLASLRESEERINSQLTRLVDWSKLNFLQLNPKKCKIMIFSKNQISLDIVLNNQLLEVVSQYKTLGLILDNKLTFNLHINSVISRITWTLRKLYTVAFYLPLTIRRCVALSLCLPLLIYGIEVYSCTGVTNINRLRICFNKVIRYIFKLRYNDHVSQYYTELFGCSFSQYIKLRQIIFFYKTMKFGEPSYLLNKFNFSNSNRTFALMYPRHTSLFMERSFCISIARLWNMFIPYQEHRFSHTLSEFRNIFLLNMRLHT